MKTTKLFIVCLFALLTAQVASAWYDPSTQRWLNRDPLGEQGFEVLHWHNARGMHTLTGVAELAQGPDLYEFDKNSPIYLTDQWGLDAATCAGCWATFYKQENLIQEAYEGCIALATTSCARYLYNPPAMSKCVMKWIFTCSGGAILGQDAAVSTLLGCLHGCQPPQPPGRCPTPPTSPSAPPGQGCSICPINNPTDFP